MVAPTDSKASTLEAALRRLKSDQLGRFSQLRVQFRERLEEVKKYDVPEFVDVQWAERNRELEESLLPVPPVDFVRHPAILYSMFFGNKYMEPELGFLLTQLDGPTLASGLQEDPVGCPVVAQGHDRSYITSSNSIHLLHHLQRFRVATGVLPNEFDKVVEWGGGYGNLAKIFRRLHGRSPTYVIVDTPLFCCIQWLYLSSVLGEDSVRLMSGDARVVEQGRVNLVPLGLITTVEDDARLFVSTWALNESSSAAQDHVVRRRWFGARHLLMGMHHGERIEAQAVKEGATSEKLGDFMPAQRYVFR